MKVKKIFLYLILFNVLLAASICGAIFWWRVNSSKVSNDSGKIRVVIEKGSSGSQVGEKLYKTGLIKNPLAFKIYLKLKGKTNTIQAGEFELSPNLSLSEVVEKLGKGPLQLLVTIPEGLRREEMPDRFIKALEMNDSRAETFREEFIKESEGKEGYLFPETYLFPRDTTAKAVVARMTGMFDSQMVQFHTALQDKKAANGLDLKQIVTLSSIIEREAKTVEERSVIAGIYFNRLDIGMALQADATTQYAVASVRCLLLSVHCDNWWPILTLDDLEINSPFNTYRISGLPPAPIANPGIASIRGVIFPQDSDYLYYIHDKDGKIHYAEDLDGHNENIRRYLGR